MEGKGRLESSENARRTLENVEWVLFGSSLNIQLVKPVLNSIVIDSVSPSFEFTSHAV